MSHKQTVIISSQRTSYLGDENSEGIIGTAEFKTRNIWRCLIAECLGTFILVLIGTGSCITMGDDHIASDVRIAFTFGLVIATLAQTIGHISGCHINPAVTISFLLVGEIKVLKAVCYIAVQMIGAIGGSGLLKLLIPENRVGGFGVTNISKEITPIQGMVIEAVLTFLLIFVIHGVCDGFRKDVQGSIPLAIGLAAACSHLTGIQYTGSSINPARSFGPAVIMNKWENHWIYWVGPLIGAVVAAVIYKLLFKVRKDEYDL